MIGGNLRKFFRKLFKSVLETAVNELDRYRKADNLLLSKWFEDLYRLFLDEEKKGRVMCQNWYQKESEAELTEVPTDPDQIGTGRPLYMVKILMLPVVIRNQKSYVPQISIVTLAEGIFPESIPEIQSRRLDLEIFDENGNKVWPETAFSRYKYSQPEKYLKHEIRYREGRELTAFEVNYMKSFYDSSITKSVEYNRQLINN